MPPSPKPPAPNGPGTYSSGGPARQTYGSGNALSSEQVAQILYQVGFRGDDLAFFVGIGKRESGNQPGVHGTTADPSKMSGDIGLFQINSVNDTPAAQAAVGYTDRSQWTDPVINAKMVFYMSHGGANKAPWSGSAGGFAANGDPYYHVDMQAARTAVDNAGTQGLLGTTYAGSSTSGPGYGSGASTGTGNASMSAGPGTPNTPVTLPPDAKIFTADGKLIALFDVGGVNISYDLPYDGTVNFGNIPVTRLTSEQWAGLNAVPAGKAEELRNVASGFGTYGKFFSSILQQVMGPHNPAANDPEVLKIIAEFAGRPDMSDVELQGKLKATQWYNTHTSGQLNWDHTSDAEKQTTRDDTAAKMADTWFQFTGERVAATDPRITNYLEDVASGKTGMGSWTENVVKKQAATNPESPLSRDTRTQIEDQKQRGVDIENTAQRVRDLATRWGVQWTQGTYTDWATNITSKNASEADLVQELQKQAQVLYPWKSPQVETQTAAQPWIQTYNRVLEKNGDIFDPKIQSALTSGKPTWEFEQELKKSPDWLQTKNGQADITTSLGDVGKLMGFS
jgi:hypothetical protein